MEATTQRRRSAIASDKVFDEKRKPLPNPVPLYQVPLDVRRKRRSGFKVRPEAADVRNGTS